MGFGEVWIITKLLINDSWSVAIFFRTFSDRPEMWPNLDPQTPYLSPKYFKEYKKYGNIFETYYFHVWESETLKLSEGLCTELVYCCCYLLSFEIWKWKTWNWGIYILTLKCGKLIIGNCEQLKLGNWKCPNWKSTKLKCPT